MNKTVLMAAAAVVALSAGSASAAKHPALTSVGSAHHAHVFVSPSKATTLYDQNSNDSGVGLLSADFDSGSFPSYSAEAADDFTIPKGSSWTISEVDVTGVYFNGYGPSDGVNVSIYKAKKGLPKGKAVETFSGAKFKDNGTGSFVITLKKAKALKAGTYFLSVQAEMNFVGGAGEWGWEVSTVQNGSEAVWQNPGGGFGVCPTWAPVEGCLGYGPDFMFALKGKAS